MSAPLGIGVRCVAVTAKLRAGGMRAFAQVVLDESVFVDGLAVRVTEAGHARVTWPERRDGQGRSHATVTLLKADARLAVERAVLDEAVRGGWLEQGRIRAAIGRQDARRAT